MENMAEQNEEFISVPYVVYRDAIAHDRWAIERLIKALIICVALIFASNGIWLYAWMQYDYVGEEVTTTVDSEGSGIANYTGGDGGVIYGEGDSPQA